VIVGNQDPHVTLRRSPVDIALRAGLEQVHLGRFGIDELAAEHVLELDSAAPEAPRREPAHLEGAAAVQDEIADARDGSIRFNGRDGTGNADAARTGAGGIWGTPQGSSSCRWWVRSPAAPRAAVYEGIARNGDDLDPYSGGSTAPCEGSAAGRGLDSAAPSTSSALNRG
jgi:hypothetical protein